MADSTGLLFDGVAADGLHIRVCEEPGDPAQRFSVFVNGEAVAIMKADRLRDGGTTIIEIRQGTFIDARRRIGRPRPVTFNGVEIQPS